MSDKERALVDALKAIWPSNLAKVPDHLPDDFVFPVDLTAGELRKVAGALALADEFPPRDEWGMTDEDWRWVRWEAEREQLAHRWKALKAIWGKPVPARYPSQYVGNERARGDDWTPWRAICATVAVVLNRNWTDKVEQRWRARHGFAGGIDMAYWDARSVYGGYTGMICWLYPRCRISIFSDGETFM